jgi:predicted NBD/HSP70 family sugar kinase
MEIGIDLGGTKIAGGLVRNGKIIKRVTVPTDAHKGKAHILKQLLHVITTLKTKQVHTIGIGIPGTHQGAKVVNCPNVSALNGVDLRKALRMPVHVANDANCFGIAEHKFGAGKGKKHMLGIIFGTGVGGVIIVDGKLYLGSGNAGEIGHQMLSVMLPTFHPGSGDWEEILSGPGMVVRHKARGGKEADPAAIWYAKNSLAKETREETLRLMAIFIANSQTVLDPEVIVLGGGLSNLPLAQGINKLLPKYGGKPIVRQGKLGGDAGILGATIHE